MVSRGRHWLVAVLLFGLSACERGSSVPEQATDADDVGDAASADGRNGDSDEGSGDEPGDAVCGNGRRESDEACDLGIGNEAGTRCTTMCTEPACGDGVRAPFEECDDANTDAGDGCSPTCLREGLPQWSLTADGDARDEYLYDIAASGDGYIAVGATHREFYDSVPLVVAIDPDERRERWRLSFDDAGPGLAAAVDVIAVDDDAVLVGVMTDAAGKPSAWVARVDPTGALVYEDMLAIAGATGVGAIVHGRPGHAIVVGDFEVIAGTPRRIWAAEIALADGTVVWHDAIASQYEISQATTLTATQDGWAIGGNARGNRWVGRYDADFSPSWERIWDDGFNARDVSVAVTSDDRIIAAGAAPIADTWFDTARWITAIDPDGSIAWEIREPALPGGSDAVLGVTVDDADGIWVAGWIKTQPLAVSAPWDYDAWIGRYDRDGTRMHEWTFDGALHGSEGAYAVLVTAPETFVVAGYATVLFDSANPWVARFGPGEREPAPAPLRPSPVAREEPRRPGDPHRGSLFIDFSGGPLHPGNWGTHREVSCLGASATYPGFFGTREEAEAVVELVATRLAPYGIAVHGDAPPPSHLPYTTAVVGGWPEQLGLGEGVKGYTCVVDCSDQWSRDVVFAFDDYATPEAIAINILHEAAHSWGLDHEEGSASIMQAFAGAADTWSTTCTPVSDATSRPICEADNAAFCPAGGQNSDAALRASFGAPGVDDVPPTIEIHAPLPDAVFDAGEPIEIEITVADDRGNPGLLVAIDALDWSRVIVGTETRFAIALPVGSHELRVSAIDHGGNATDRTVAIHVHP